MFAMTDTNNETPACLTVSDEEMNRRYRHIPIYIDSELYNGFADTGSDLSAINGYMRRRIDMNSIQECNRIVSTANGLTRIEECVLLKVDFGFGVKEHMFYIFPNLSKDVLIGNDLMVSQKIDLYPSTRSWGIDGKKFPLACCTPQCDPASESIKLIEDVEYIKEQYIWISRWKRSSLSF